MLATDVIEKQVYYFTFGMGHDLQGHVQPILASSYKSARETMFDKYGNKFAFQYTRDEYFAKWKHFQHHAILSLIEGR